MAAAKDGHRRCCAPAFCTHVHVKARALFRESVVKLFAQYGDLFESLDAGLLPRSSGSSEANVVGQAAGGLHGSSSSSASSSSSSSSTSSSSSGVSHAHASPRCAGWSARNLGPGRADAAWDLGHDSDNVEDICLFCNGTPCSDSFVESASGSVACT